MHAETHSMKLKGIPVSRKIRHRNLATFNFSLLALCSSLVVGVVSCNQNELPLSQGSGMAPGIQGSVQPSGICTLTGDIRSFRLECSAEIQHFSINGGGISITSAMQLTSHSFSIQKVAGNNSQAVGSETTANVLSFSLRLVDGKSVTITFPAP